MGWCPVLDILDRGTRERAERHWIPFFNGLKNISYISL
jgi:hypothetical protein